MIKFKRKGKVLALGLFDSLHLGHRYLIQKANSYAKVYNYKFLLLTFDDNIYDFINLNQKNIYTIKERTRILKNLGLDFFVIKSSKEFFSLDDKGFYNYLKQFTPKAIFVGEDYTYGAKGKWQSEDLKNSFRTKRIEVNIIDLLNIDNKKVSTSLIKKHIEKGNINLANNLLGDNYFAIGNVIHGKGIGGTLGIPTANFVTDKNKLLPKWGVYATNAIIDGISYKSITNVGNQPTFENSQTNIETHILDFSSNIYGKEIVIEFKERLRDIQSFVSVQALREQIMIDIERARNYD